ncbi:MAG: hypothetical protein R3C59_02445 [Planctomycetaceae bacterium]
MTQKRVLLGWDLGAGIGYVQKLRTIALALSKAGFAPILALRSLDPSHSILSDLPFPVIQAPYITGRLTAEAEQHGFRPTSFADLMACNGFGSVDHLYSMVRGWRDLIDIVKPELIVGTHCPLLTVAAYRRIPVVLFGSPYYTPPAHEDTFPAFFPDQPPYANQQQMLETVQQVQRMFGAPMPDCITEIYRGDHRCITVVPELDPYREWRTETCDGIFDACCPVQKSRGVGFYAYLAGTSDLTYLIVETLLRSGLTGSIYVRDASVDRWELPVSDRVRIHRAAPELNRIVRSAAVVIHHGGPGTAQAALAAGVPQILIPQVLDQWLSARALGVLPFVRSLVDEVTGDEILRAVESIYHNEGCETDAHEFARSIRQRGLHNAKQKIIDACLQELRSGSK